MRGFVRLFLRQSVIRQRLPFEVVADDPFFSDANQRVLAESIRSYEHGEAKRRDTDTAASPEGAADHSRG